MLQQIDHILAIYDHSFEQPQGLYLTRKMDQVVADLAGLSLVMRGKDYQWLKRDEGLARMKPPPDQHLAHPESGMVRTLYDCPDLPLGPEGMRCRIIVATHPAGATKSRIGVTRSDVVYELFVTNLPQSAFTAADVVALYLHRGAFEKDRKSTRLNSSHTVISYAVFCLKKKK